MNVHDQTTGKSLSNKYRPNTEQFPNKLKHIIRFGVGDTGKDVELEIPEHLQDHFWVSHLRDLFHREPSNKPYDDRQIMTLFLAIFEDEPNPNMRQIGSIWVERAKKDLKIADSTLYHMNLRARSMFLKLSDWIDDRDIKILIQEFAGTRNKINDFGSWPKIDFKSLPQKSLEQVLQVDGYDNLTDDFLIKCFTEFTFCHLKVWSEMRTKLRDEHKSLFSEICLFISDYGVDKIEAVELYKNAQGARAAYGKGKLSPDDFKIYCDIWVLLLKVVKALENDFLIVNALTQIKSSYIDPYRTEILESSSPSERYLHYFEAGPRHKNPWKGIKIKTGTYLYPMLPISLLDLVRPSVEERMCTTWVLALKRIQKSNVERLLFDNVTVGAGARGVQQIKVKAFKARGGEKTEYVTYNKNSNWGRSLSFYLNERKMHSNSLPMETFFEDKFIGKIENQRWNLANLPNFNYLEEDLTKDEVGFSQISDDCYDFLKALFRQHASKNTTTLGPSYFNQSGVYEDFNNEISDIRVKDDMQLNPHEPDRFEQEMEAQRQFHTLETREAVYKSRSKTKLKLKLGEQLAVAVSDEMHATVEQLLQAKSQKAAVLSFKEIQQEIGLTDSNMEASPEAILAAAKAQDYIVQRNGFVTKNGQTFIFDCGLVARFMLEARAHIESNNGKGLEQVFMTQGREKGLNIWAEYIFLDYILEHGLSPSSMKSALQDYAHLEGKIPHRPLTEGGVI